MIKATHKTFNWVLAYRFRGLVCYHGGECGNRQAGRHVSETVSEGLHLIYKAKVDRNRNWAWYGLSRPQSSSLETYLQQDHTSLSFPKQVH